MPQHISATSPRTPVGLARGSVALLSLAALWCVTSACGSSGTSVTAGSPGASQSAATTAPGGAKRIDACSMLSPQDISPLLGVSVPGVSTGKAADQADCTWTNTATEESVSLTISNPGTALHNKLPAPDSGFPDPGTPGPDGMRYLGGGSVEFAAGDRINTVQVAVLRMSADQANAAAVNLARKIAPMVPR
ncbi:hypothetical protein MSAS_18700 [Mycobacterium saskatchewanense]|nr:hypothetical protein [Mycobacterium saskatchewanense]BBX62696.1 hypothetical protein MSAS_18700 [Mycobacterium saskatchewanense]